MVGDEGLPEEGSAGGHSGVASRMNQGSGGKNCGECGSTKELLGGSCVHRQRHRGEQSTGKGWSETWKSDPLGLERQVGAGMPGERAFGMAEKQGEAGLGGARRRIV